MRERENVNDEQIIRIIKSSKSSDFLKDRLMETENLFSKFLRKSGFYLTIRNLSTAQLELISRCMHSLRLNSPQQFAMMILKTMKIDAFL